MYQVLETMNIMLIYFTKNIQNFLLEKKPEAIQKDIEPLDQDNMNIKIISEKKLQK
jgi:hypothetical protein